MPVTSSMIMSQIVQADGTIQVTEAHVYAPPGNVPNGTILAQTVNFVYNAPATLDIVQTATLRGQNIGNTMDATAQAKAQATNFEIPLQKSDLLLRFQQSELQAFYASTDPNVQYAQQVWSSWNGSIYRTNPLTVGLFGILQSAGILSAARVAAVLA